LPRRRKRQSDKAGFAEGKRGKWKIVSSYKDAGISGASMILRGGHPDVIAGRGAFDVVVAAPLDRFQKAKAAPKGGFLLLIIYQ
jgi:hypothetical protein